MRTALSLVFVVALSVLPAFAQSEDEIQEQAAKVNALNDALWALEHDDLESIAKNDPEAFADAMQILADQVKATQDDIQGRMSAKKCGYDQCPGHGENTHSCPKGWPAWLRGYHDNAKDLDGGRSNRQSLLEKAKGCFEAAEQYARNHNASDAMWWYNEGKRQQSLDNFLVAAPDVISGAMILSPPTGLKGAIKGAKVLKALSDLNSRAVDGIRKDVQKQRDEEQKKLKQMLKATSKDSSAKGINKILDEARKAKSEE